MHKHKHQSKDNKKSKHNKKSKDDNKYKNFNIPNKTNKSVPKEYIYDNNLNEKNINDKVFNDKLLQDRILSQQKLNDEHKLLNGPKPKCMNKSCMCHKKGGEQYGPIYYANSAYSVQKIKRPDDTPYYNNYTYNYNVDVKKPQLTYDNYMFYQRHNGKRECDLYKLKENPTYNYNDKIYYNDNNVNYLIAADLNPRDNILNNYNVNNNFIYNLRNELKNNFSQNTIMNNNTNINPFNASQSNNFPSQ